MTRKSDGDTEGKGGKKYGNEKPISLHPLAPEEALRRAMTVRPPPKEKRPRPKEDGKD